MERNKILNIILAVIFLLAGVFFVFVGLTTRLLCSGLTEWDQFLAGLPMTIFGLYCIATSVFLWKRPKIGIYLALLAIIFFVAMVVLSSSIIKSSRCQIEHKIENAEVVYVTVNDLVRSPNTFLSKGVKVTGKLINTKSSYFPSPDFAIADRSNDQVRFKVTAWLPLEVPPPPPDSTQEQPPTMQSYLNKIVNLAGTVRQIGSSFYLDVLSGEYATED